MPVALEDHRLKDDEPLHVPASLPDSCEFFGQRMNKVASDPPARRVIPPCGHARQGFTTGMPILAVLYSPTEVCSTIGVHSFSIDLLDPPVLPRGNVTGQISRSPLAFPCYGLISSFVSAFSLRSFFRIASGNGGAALHAAAADPSRRATFRLPPPHRLMSGPVSPIAETGRLRTCGTSSRRNGVLTSNRRISGSCRPTLVHICIKIRPEDSLRCPLGVLPQSTYPPPPPFPPVERRREWL